MNTNYGVRISWVLFFVGVWYAVWIECKEALTTLATIEMKNITRQIYVSKTFVFFFFIYLSFLFLLILRAKRLNV
jgi:hypothetical protein